PAPAPGSGLAATGPAGPWWGTRSAPRLLAVLARRRLRAWPAPALVRQAVRARLGQLVGLGQDAAGAGAAGRGGGGHAAALRGGIRADHRRATVPVARAFRGSVTTGAALS